MKRKASYFFNFRPVPLFAVGMCIGVFLGDINLIIFLCIAAILFIAALILRSKYAAVVCIGILCALVRLVFVPSAVTPGNDMYIVRGTVCKTSDDYFIIDDVTLNSKGVSGKIKVVRSCNFKTGDIIKFRSEIRSTNSLFNRRTMLANGILYYADNPELPVKVSEAHTVRTFFASLRSDWSNRIDSVFGKNAGIVKGMMLGDTSDIDFSDLSALRSAGVAHILALSGLHVSIAAGFLNLLGSHTLGRRFAYACTPIVLTIYVATVGFPVSFVRALIAVAFRSFAELFYRRYDSPVALGTAAVLLLFINPYTLFSASFLLSFGCAFSIMMLSEPLNRLFRDNQRRKHIRNPFRESLSLNIAASAGAVPMSASIFGNVPVFSVIANLFCVPLASLALICAFFGCFFDLLSLDLAHIAASFVNTLLDIVRDISFAFTSFPFSVITVGKIPFVFVLLIFAAFFVLSDYFFLCKKKKAVFALSLVVCAFLSLLI